MDTIPTIKVFHGRITAINGATSGEGDCASLTFSGYGCASWDPHLPVTFSSLAAANLLSCDVKNKAPVVGDFCEIWYGEDGTVKLFLKTHQIPFKDCP